MDRSDYARIIDAAHHAGGSGDEWLRGLIAALRPVLDRGLGVRGWFHDANEHSEGAPAAGLDAPASEPVSTLRAVGGDSAVDGAVVDVLRLLCMDVDGHGLEIAAPASRTVELSAGERERLQRIVAHITAAFRLRRRQGATEAVVSPSGRIAHAEGPARSQRAREMLRAAAVGYDRARTRGRDADEALDLHRALIAGRWTLVDAFEQEGKRYLIARNNTPEPAPTPELSVRETQVVVFSAMGHPLKMIAYELGLSESCVATYLRRALAKLGLPDRLTLTRRFGFLVPAGAGARS